MKFKDDKAGESGADEWVGVGQILRDLGLSGPGTPLDRVVTASVQALEDPVSDATLDALRHLTDTVNRYADERHL